ncbi:peptidylprolyl isomerase [Pseudogracilibacillus sp. SE30717A]|uniref:peptidylprolyl isomerase n=1 Tax=Pseudogracilibacillus sp. SE30717A TaxID=3098293 RepID=UPI00300E3043
MQCTLYKKMFLFISIFVLAVVLVGCGSNSEESKEKDMEETDQSAEQKTENEQTTPSGEHPIVTMNVEGEGKVLIELYPDVAPNTVNNFISLVEDGFYDGLIFHRVIPGFMIQGGDPEGTGMGGPGYSIKGEFNSNDFANNLEHERGVISMARSQASDSAGSQFFIMTDDSPHLDGDYAAFGKVIEGMDVVDKIVSVERDNVDKPLEDQVIESMKIDLNGYEAVEPEVIE